MWQSDIERREFGHFQVVVLALMQLHEPANTLMFSLSTEFVLLTFMYISTHTPEVICTEDPLTPDMNILT